MVSRSRLSSLPYLSCAVLACTSVACAKKAATADAPSSSEVAVSVVSGALNNSYGSSVALRPSVPEQGPRPNVLQRALAFLNPIGTAYAAEWSCAGTGLTPSFDGGGSYSFTPPSCQVTWGAGDTVTSAWSGPFTLAYGATCDGADPLMESQPSGCTRTRTGPGGVTRTITGPEGNSYAIDHDTNGAGTGYDPTVTPAPTDGGVEVACNAGGCATGLTLSVNGSHLTGTVTVDGDSFKVWDHTVSTTQGGIVVTGTGSSRVVNGSVVVQHNIIHVTATTTFNGVGYGQTACCFPTSGSVSTTFSAGTDRGKTESIAFTPACGEVTLTGTDGKTAALTLTQCL